MPYIGIPPFGQTVRTVTTVTASASQTAFTPTGGYIVGYVDVYYNGVKLVDGDDYTATNGSTVTLATAANAGDAIELVSYMPVSLADTYRQAEADSRFVNVAGDTMTGALNVLVNNGDLTGIRTFHGSSATYNPATNGTPDKIVSGVDLVWYSDSWRIGATRGGGADIQELMFVRSSNSTVTKHLGIDSAGRVTMPYQPVFRAQRSSVSTSVSVLSTTTVVFDTTSVNVGNHYNTSTGLFTCPVSGRYIFSFFGLFHDISNYVYGGIAVNGSLATNSVTAQFHSPQSTGNYEQMTVSNILNLAAGDTVSIMWQANGGTPYMENRNGFMGYLLG